MDNVAEIIVDMFELATNDPLNVVAVKISGLIGPGIIYKSNEC